MGNLAVREFHFGYNDLDEVTEIQDILKEKYVGSDEKRVELGQDLEEDNFCMWIGYGDDCMNYLVIDEKIANDKELVERIEGVSKTLEEIENEEEDFMDDDE